MSSPKIIKFLVWCLCFSLGLSGCAEMGELQKPAASPYYGALLPDANNEFRWANGDLPKTFDPALARTPSETQAVRAVFDGLTEWDQKTLEAVPALAARWDSSEDLRTWTFHLRPALWSNGERITAADFVRSWQRLKNFGVKSSNQSLISNIIGAQISDLDKDDQQTITNTETELPEIAISDDEPLIQNPKSKIQNETWFGVEALNKQILRVYLKLPDKDFPKLAAHSALRLVSDDNSDNDNAQFERTESAPKLITSGAFRVRLADQSGVLFERSKNYWNASAVKPERVRFVATKDAETALAAYRAGSIDAVTSAHIEPLALKLLASYRDFKRTTHNAVTFYEFNSVRPPFSDRRVRQALAISLDRARLTNDELDGATFPALDFLPDSTRKKFQFDVKQAQKLLADAGFANSKDFPKIKLLVNRNDAAFRVAKAVAAQWKKNLKIETEIVVSSLDDLENSESTKDFDLIRRVAVLPTTNEIANLRYIFKRPGIADLESKKGEAMIDPNNAPAASSATPTPNGFPKNVPTLEPIEDAPQINGGSGSQETKPTSSANQTKVDQQFEDLSAEQADEKPSKETVLIQSLPSSVLSESEIIEDIPAIPLYFSSSYLLVKPYVQGFEANLLDAPMLRDVEIQSDWRPTVNIAE